MHSFVLLRNLLAFVLSGIVSSIAGTILFMFLYEFIGIDEDTAGIAGAIVAFILLYYTYSYCKKLLQDITKYINGESIDPKYFAIAEEEINRGEIVSAGLWSMALISARGNEDMRSIEYMKLRASQLQKEDATH